MVISLTLEHSLLGQEAILEASHHWEKGDELVYDLFIQPTDQIVEINGLQLNLQYESNTLELTDFTWFETVQENQRMTFLDAGLTEQSLFEPSAGTFNVLLFPENLNPIQLETGKRLIQLRFRARVYDNSLTSIKLGHNENYLSLVVLPDDSFRRLGPMMTEVNLPTITEKNDLHIINDDAILEAGTSFRDEGAYYLADDGTIQYIYLDAYEPPVTLGLHSLTYQLTTDSGVFIEKTRVITIADRIPPQITPNLPTHYFHDMAQPPVTLSATAMDLYDGQVSVEVEGSIDFTQEGEYTIRYAAKDSSGNQSELFQTITVGRNKSPQFQFPVTKFNYAPEAFEIPIFLSPNGQGILGFQGSINYNPEELTFLGTSPKSNQPTDQEPVYEQSPFQTDFHLKENGIVNFLWYAENQIPVIYEAAAPIGYVLFERTPQASDAAVISLGSDQLPVMLVTTQGTHLPPAAISTTILFNELSATPKMIGAFEPSVVHSLSIPFVDTPPDIVDYRGFKLKTLAQVPNMTSSIGDYNIGYQAVDVLGNLLQLNREVLFRDLDPPTIELIGSLDVELEYGETFKDPGYRVSDNYDGNPEVQITDLPDLIPDIGSYEITYVAVDTSGNRSTAATRSIIIADNQAPSVSLKGNPVIQLEIFEPFEDPGLNITDNYPETPLVNVAGSVNVEEIGNYTLEYTISDFSGNLTRISRMVQVVDSTPPSLELVGDSIMWLKLGEDFSDPGYIASDNADLAPAVITQADFNKHIVGDYFVNYWAQDASGNQSAKITREIRYRDRIGFEVALVGQSVLYHEVNTPFVDPGVIAIHNGTIISEVSIVGEVNAKEIGTYTLFYNVTDLEGVIHTTQREVICQDTTAPSINFASAWPEVIEVFGQLVAPDILVVDNYDSQPAYQVQSNLDTRKPGTYSISVSATDQAGNEASAPDIEIKVIDSTPPMLLLIGGEEIDWEAGFAYADPGFTVTDNHTTEPEVTLSGVVDHQVLGNYQVTFEARDTFDNTTIKTRNVVVRDTLAPVLADQPAGLIVHEAGTPLSLDGVRFVDTFDPAPTLHTQIVAEDLPTGLHSIEVWSTDFTGNQSDLVTLQLDVRDTIAPLIALKGPEEMNWDVGMEYTDPGVTITDAGDPHPLLTITNGVNSLVLGAYEVSYTASDLANNVNRVTRTVRIIDQEAPVIELFGSDELVFSHDEVPAEPGYKASDNYDREVKVTVDGFPESPSPGTYQVSYSASDSSGNQSKVFRTIIISPEQFSIKARGSRHTERPDHVVIHFDLSGPQQALMGLQGTIRFNPEIITPKILTNGSIALTATATDPLGSKLFDVSDFNIAGPGALNFLWFSEDLVPRAFVDGFLFAVAFDVIESGEPMAAVEFGSFDIDAFAITDEIVAVPMSPSLDYVIFDDPDAAPAITLNGGQNLIHEVNEPFVDPGASAVDYRGNPLEITSNGKALYSLIGDHVIQYQATDSIGNTNAAERWLQIVDTTPPDIMAQGANPYWIELGEQYEEPGVSVSDNYDPAPEITIESGLDPSAIGEYSIIYHAIDHSGNASTAERIVKVTDTQGPKIVVDVDKVITHEIGSPFMAPVWNALDPSEVIDSELDLVAVNFEKLGQYPAVIRATDNQANTSTRSFDIAIIDTQAPTVSLLGPSSLTLFTDSSYNEFGVTVTDNNPSGEITIQYPTVEFPMAPGIYTLEYTASDASDNISAVTTRILTVVEPNAGNQNRPPEIQLIGEATLYHDAGTPFIDPGATVADDNDPELELITYGSIDPNIIGSQSLTYTAMDRDGLFAQIIEREVVVQDLTPPKIELIGDANLFLEVGSVYEDQGVTVEDFDPKPHLLIEGFIDTSVLGQQRIIYSAVDSSGNRTKKIVRLISVIDTQPPTMELIGEKVILLEVGTSFSDPGILIEDNHDHEPQYVSSGDISADIPGFYTIRYDAVDASGNKATTLVRSVAVSDRTPPTLELIGDPLVVLEYGEVYQDQGVIALDNYDAEPSVNSNADQLDSEIPGIFQITYTAKDVANNRSLPVIRLVQVLENKDRKPPMITLNGERFITLNIGEKYEEPGATAEDDVDGAVEVTISDTVKTNMPGNYNIIYQAVDASGNKARPVTRLVSVRDSTPPLLSLLGPKKIILAIGEQFNEPGYNCSDNFDDTPIVTISDLPDSMVPGTYTLTYTAKDKSGNVALPETRFIIIKDSQAPTQILNGPQKMILAIGEPYEEFGVEVVDNHDSSPSTTIAGVVDTANKGIYPITYISRDQSGNKSVPLIRLVMVKEKPPKPIISLKGKTFVSIGLGEIFQDPGILVQNFNIEEVNLIVTGEVDVQQIGQYTIKYVAISPEGLVSDEIIRIVEVKDIRAPTIDLIGNQFMRVVQFTDFTDPGAVISDDHDVSVVLRIEGQVDVTQTGIYNLLYSGSDASGNKSRIVVRNVEVIKPQDKEAPVIRLLGETHMLMKLDDIFVDPGFEATDNEDPIVEVNVTGQVNTSLEGLYIIRYDGNDAAGNEAIPQIRFVRVEKPRDHTPPTIKLLGKQTMNWEQFLPFEDPLVEAKDDVDANPTIETIGSVNVNISGHYVITYYAVDGSGNKSDALTRVVNVIRPKDQVPPNITLLGDELMELIQGDPFEDPGILANDNLDGTLSVKEYGVVDIETPGLYTLTYVATDSSSNRSSVTRMVRVTDPAEDVSAPDMELNGESFQTLEAFEGNYVDPGVTMTDDFDENPDLVVIGEVIANKPGYYSITYVGVDHSGNRTEPIVRVVQVIPSPGNGIPLTASSKRVSNNTITISRLDSHHIVLDWTGEHELLVSGSSSGPYLPTGVKQGPYLINHEDSLAEGVQFFKLR